MSGAAGAAGTCEAPVAKQGLLSHTEDVIQSSRNRANAINNRLAALRDRIFGMKAEAPGEPTGKGVNADAHKNRIEAVLDDLHCEFTAMENILTVFEDSL